MSLVGGFPLGSFGFPFINMHKGQILDVTNCYNLGKKWVPAYVISGYLHTNKCPPPYVMSVFLIQTKHRLARSLLTLIGHCRLFYVFLQVQFARKIICWSSAILRKPFFHFLSIMAFYYQR